MSLRDLFDVVTRRSVKFDHYFPIYERHLGKFVGKSPVVVEIGVDDGGSLEMWQRWFGEGTRVIGIDHNPKCAKLGFETIIGKQGDIEKMALPDRVDVVIDDGSHQVADQFAALRAFQDRLTPGGVHLIEDLHARWKNPALYAKPSDPPHGILDRMQETVLRHFRETSRFGSFCFYPYVLVIEKDDGQSLAVAQRTP